MGDTRYDTWREELKKPGREDRNEAWGLHPSFQARSSYRKKKGDEHDHCFEYPPR